MDTHYGLVLKSQCSKGELLKKNPAIMDYSLFSECQILVQAVLVVMRVDCMLALGSFASYS